MSKLCSKNSQLGSYSTLAVLQGFKEKDPRKKFPKNRRRSGSKNRILFPSHPRCSRSVPTATLQSGKIKPKKKKKEKEKEIQRVGSGKRGNSGIKTVKSQEGIFSREKLLSRPHPPHPQALVSSSGPVLPLEKKNERIPVIPAAFPGIPFSMELRWFFPQEKWDWFRTRLLLVLLVIHLAVVVAFLILLEFREKPG